MITVTSNRKIIRRNVSFFKRWEGEEGSVCKIPETKQLILIKPRHKVQFTQVKLLYNKPVYLSEGESDTDQNESSNTPLSESTENEVDTDLNELFNPDITEDKEYELKQNDKDNLLDNAMNVELSEEDWVHLAINVSSNISR